MKSKFLLSILLIILAPVCLFAQGSIMLVGGGGEDSFNSSPNWSNTPYQWAVNQSANKKVAVITYNPDNATSFLPNYFLDLGATASKNFVFATRDTATHQAVYDSLMNYDVFFFKGGDQAEYYELYQNSKVTEAITDKFNAGGVICGTSAGMAILSGVIFPAIDGTVYPDEVLANSNRSDIILKNDFVNILPNYIADSHFIERGRFARIMSFMGRWQQDESENIGGIGVDDQTAFCIDANMVGTAYGNGAVSIFTLSDYSTSDNKPVADSVAITHLIYGKQYNLDSKELTSTYSTEISPIGRGESGDYTVYLAGSSTYAHNIDLLDEIIANANSQITIVARKNSSLANSYADYLEDNSSEEVKIISVDNSIDSCSSVEERNFVRESATFLFVDNSDSQLFDFLESHSVGQTIKAHAFKAGNLLAFFGEDAKYAGKTYVTNNTADNLNAFYGDLEFEDGIGVLSNSTIVPNAFPSSTEFYENNSAAIKYAMVAQRLQYGIYVNERSYVKFFQQDAKNWIDAVGNSSAILLTNQSEKGDFASESVNSSGDTRNVVGFEKMKYSLLSGNPQMVGTPTESSSPSNELEVSSPNLNSSKNSEEHIELTWNSVDNITGYKIERSVNSGSFAEVASPSSTATSYIDTDTELLNQYTYRIKAVNGTISSCYSDETSPIVTSIEDELFSKIHFPNPITSGSFSLTGLEGRKIGIEITDASGRVTLDWANYQNQENINVSDLPSGLYILRLKYQNNIDSHKIFIQN